MLVAAALSVLSACGTPYYAVCDEGGRCPGGYVCADRTALPVCTTLCAADDECRDLHGERSFCAPAGVCLSACAVSEDCPPTAYCDVTSRTCRR